MGTVHFSLALGHEVVHTKNHHFEQKKAEPKLRRVL